MKILHITSSLKIGGAEHVLHTLASHLDASKFEQYVIFFHEGPYVQKLQALGIPTIQIKGFFFRYDPIFLWRLYRTIKKLNPDCLHTMLWIANMAGRLCAWAQGVPCVSVFHNNVDQDGAVRNLIDRLTLRFADILVAVSDPVAKSAQQFLGCKKEIMVIKNGIDFDARIDSILRKSDQFIIGAVGRFEPVKRYDLLLKCVVPLMKKYAQVQLYLIGLGSQEKLLRARANELGVADRVLFLIAKPALEYYPLFDCFAQTTAKEGISIALLEAMSFGVPAVVMHEGKEHPVIEHQKTGLVVDANDADGFTAALETLVVDGLLRARLGATGQEKVREGFGAERMVKAYEKLFLSATGDYHVPPFAPKS